ncbi:hypothetical protein PYW08_013001 [Mythimna loreyi]|uniref:Uncharacterized protein n=1 Tax=Mythimna loreyi TaxID=667449 RepID=A0ACC2Q0L9_9NEOP|nr:hypothetical protein PYW08_013001 [Mythimna loreyi]
MPKVQRTPPKTPRVNLTDTQSEPDITAASEYVTSRSKRPRTGNSPSSQGDVDLETHEDTSLATKIEVQTTIMSKLMADIREIKLQNVKIQESNAEICKTNNEIERAISFMNKNYEELRKEVESLKKEKQEQRCYIESLEKKIVDLQSKSRSAGVEIRNIPLSNNENASGLTQTVCSIGKLVGVPITEPELRDIYRLPGKSTPATTACPIIAEFTSVNTKQKLISAVRAYNKKIENKDNKLNTEQIGIPGKRQPVYVAELLPTSSKKLFHLAREFSKNNSFAFCWTSNGNIFLRKKEGDKQVLIKSEKCLQDLGMKII